jgi:formate/nitrite transporter FocA (FNT family)
MLPIVVGFTVTVDMFLVVELKESEYNFIVITEIVLVLIYAHFDHIDTGMFLQLKSPFDVKRIFRSE